MLHRLLILALLAGTLPAASAAALAQNAPADTNAPAAQSAPAPAAGRPHARHHNRMQAALAQLGLSDDQKAKIRHCMTAFRQSRDGATPETRKELRAQIEQILTPDQRTQFAAAMKPHAEPAANSPS